MNNLLKMERYRLLHNGTYWCGVIGISLIGFFTAETYLPEVMGPGGGAAASLADIFNGMVYDSTLLLILISSILALIFGQEFSCRTITLEVSAGHGRTQIFVSKLLSYLIEFNFMAITYPIAGCIREYMRFGIANAGIFFPNVIKAVFYSFLLNSVIFLIAIFLCCCFQNTAKSVAVTATVTFTLSLYLGYGMMMDFPVAFLPIFQIREAVGSSLLFLPAALLTAVIWGAVLIYLSWRMFCRGDLK